MCVGYYLITMYLLDEISYTVLDMLDNKGPRVSSGEAGKNPQSIGENKHSSKRSFLACIVKHWVAIQPKEIP